MKTKSHTGPPGKASNLSHFALWRALVGKDEDLDARDAASTFFRLFRSKHVLDLKVILYAACILVGVCLVIAACWAIFLLASLLCLTLKGRRPRLLWLVRLSQSAVP